MNAVLASGQPVTGGCLCGAVRFRAVLESGEANACHCSMCRKWSAGPYLSVHCTSFEIAGAANLGLYRSSDWAERGFCPKCGTSLFYRLVDAPFYAVSAEAFDENPRFEFTSQIFVDEKPAYYEFANETKELTGAEVFAAFQASQAKE